MDIFVVLLTLIGAIKCWEIAAAARWLARRGQEYRQELEAHDMKEFDACAERVGGLFLPTGYKDLRLRRFAASRQRGERGYALRRLAGQFQRHVFAVRRLTVLGVLSVIAATALAEAAPSALLLPGEESWLLYALSVTLLIATLLIVAEEVMALVILGAYAVPFHQQDPARAAGHSVVLLELRIFMRVCVNAVICAAAGVFTMASLRGSFQGLPRAKGFDVEAVLRQLIGSLYYVVSTFATVGYGDIVPRDVPGRILATLTEIATFAVVALLLSVLTVMFSRNSIDRVD